MVLSQIIQKIDILKTELDKLGPLNGDTKEQLAQKIRLEWNYHSNVIEGNELNFGETKSLLLYGLTANGKPLKDHLDMKGHNEALKKLEQITNREVSITENLIKEFHKIILVDPYLEHPDIEPGKLKRVSNYLYNEEGERVDFTKPADTAAALNELINWTNNAIFVPKRKKAKYETHPLLIATIFHLKFVTIHPFDDGNGRIARIFMNLILMQCGYPPVIIKQEERKEYFNAINKARNEGPEILAEFIGKAMIRSLELYLKAAKGESIEELDDLDKEIMIWKKGLNSEKANVEEKSDTNILHVYQKSLRDLLVLFDQRVLSNFSDLYTKTRHQASVNSGGRTNAGIEYFDEIIGGDQINNGQNSEINNISYSIYLDGFKKDGVNTFATTTWIEIKFEQFVYQVQYEYNKTIKQKLYSELIDERERQEIVGYIIKNMFDQIQKSIQK